MNNKSVNKTEEVFSLGYVIKTNIENFFTKVEEFAFFCFCKDWWIIEFSMLFQYMFNSPYKIMKKNHANEDDFVYGEISVRTICKILKDIEANRDDVFIDLGSGRGYSRIWEIGVHFLWGVGEGAYNRFQTMKGMEIHSTFASLLVSYGLTGLIGYALIFFRGIVYRGNAIRNLIVFSGVLLYQVTHNGIRNTLLWLFLALFILHQTTLLSPDCTSLSKRTI